MYEISALVNRKPAKMALSVIEFPSGRFGFVGSVPEALAYEGPADAIAIGRQMGMGFVRHRGVKTMTWATREDALAAAAAIGADVANA